MCSMHEGRKWRKASPLRATFLALKSNAKRRRKIFTITFYDFVELVEQTDYMNNRGRKDYNLHIDRIEEEFGYVPGNVQVISHHDNREKRLVYLKKKAENEPF